MTRVNETNSNGKIAAEIEIIKATINKLSTESTVLDELLKANKTTKREI